MKTHYKELLLCHCHQHAHNIETNFWGDQGNFLGGDQQVSVEKYSGGVVNLFSFKHSLLKSSESVLSRGDPLETCLGVDWLMIGPFPLILSSNLLKIHIRVKVVTFPPFVLSSHNCPLGVKFSDSVPLLKWARKWLKRNIEQHLSAPWVSLIFFGRNKIFFGSTQLVLNVGLFELSC